MSKKSTAKGYVMRTSALGFERGESVTAAQLEKAGVTDFDGLIQSAVIEEAKEPAKAKGDDAAADEGQSS